jgi:aspartyl-tRNA(Asn)/glutamyl-tRNA(Gln) amidotransferase subunit B
VTGDLLGLLNAQGRDIANSPVSAQNLGELVKMIGDGRLSGKLAKEIFPRMYETGEAPAAVMKREGLRTISDEGELTKVIAGVIAANPRQVEQYKGGKLAVINFLVGQAMRATRGQADVARVTELLRHMLNPEQNC